MSLRSSTPARLGRYEVIGLLATGGMAEVHLGRMMGPSGFERVVVLKRILPHLAREAAFVDMFLDEARIVAKISHPNVIQVSELARDADELFLAMEFVEGESLGGFMRRHWVNNEPIGLELAAFIVSEMCAGLHAAHELTDDDGKPQGVVHRDVSPQNVMITYTGRVKVLDFGIAKAHDRATRTATGELKGKVEYMSPEQCRALPLDRRSDVFALGILLYELSMGKRLFRRGGELASLRAVCEDPIPTPRSIDPDYPAELEAICMRALSRSPNERYATAAEMRRDLVAWLRSTPNVGLHEELLGERMRALFADRALNKRELLRNLKAGSSPGSLPAPEVDLAVEPPVVAASSSLPARVASVPSLPAPEVAPPRRRGWRAPLAVATGAAVAVVGWLALGAVRDKQAAATTSETIAPAPRAAPSIEVTVAPTATPVKVVIDITTTPSGARVSIGSHERGTTPMKLELDRGAQPVKLDLALPGYDTLTETVTPDVDQRLALSLQRAARSRSGPRPQPQAQPSATASGGRYRKFN